MLELAGVEALALFLDDEGADPVVLAVGDGEDDVEVGDRGVGDPVLLPVDHPLVAVADGVGPHRGGVAARLGLREREGGRPLAAGAFGQEALLQLVGAEELDRQRAELLDHQDQGRGGAGLGDLLDRHLQDQGPGAGAAVLLGEGQAEDVVLGEQLAHVPRVLAFAVDLAGARRDLLLRQPAHHVAQVARLLRDLVGAGLWRWSSVGSLATPSLSLEPPARQLGRSATSSGPSPSTSSTFSSSSPRSAKLRQSCSIAAGVDRGLAFAGLDPRQADLERRPEHGEGDGVAAASRSASRSGSKNQPGMTIPSTIVK